jgi:hypothetical protein
LERTRSLPPCGDMSLPYGRKDIEEARPFFL